jgi:uncharacterized membrane protein
MRAFDPVNPMRVSRDEGGDARSMGARVPAIDEPALRFSRIRNISMKPQSPWRFVVFYFDKADPRLWVPKRTHLGWTLNFGRRVSWVVLGAFVLAVAAGIVAYYVHAR